MIKAAFLGLLLVSFTACVKNRDEGSLQTENRTFTGTFDQVETNGSMDVFFTTDSSYDIKVECGENLIPYVTTAISNGKLTIRIEHNPIFTRKNVRVYVSADWVKTLTAYGSGNINIERTTADNIYLHLKGSGNINANVFGKKVYADIEGSGNMDLSGTLNENDLEVTGSGNINCRNITVNYCNAIVDGSGNITCNVASKLDALITGSGDIKYAGNPSTVNSKITGSGNISKIY